MPNENNNFLPVNSKEWKMVERPMIASVEMEEGAAVYRVGDGTHTLSTNATGNFEGILVEPITSTDSDYATSKKLKKVIVPRVPRAELFFTVGDGTFTTDDLGKSVKLNDSKSLAVDTAGTQAVITGYESSSRGRCFLNEVIS